MAVRLLTGLMLAVILTHGAHAAPDPAVRFMKRLQAPLLRAARSSSAPRFHAIIRRYADIKGIAEYSIGSYGPRISRRRKPVYYRGVGRFMAKFFAKQTKSYKVARAEITQPSWKEGASHYVDSKVFLKNGTVYSVRWELKRAKSGYRIRNVRILGFWLAWFQRNLFQDYIDKKKGNVNALVRVLNRF